MSNIVFKCRCSAIGKIMTNPQGKSNYDLYVEALEKLEALQLRLVNFKDQKCKSAVEIETNTIPRIKELISELRLVKDKKELSKTCKQYLKEWILSHKYKRRKEFSSKQTSKGNQTEQDGFQVIQDVLFKGIFLPKNKTQYEDDYFMGMQDVIIEDFVIDNKSSWNLFTFPMGETEIDEEGYTWQGRGYLRLANKENFLLCYTLNDTPTELIEDEIFRYKKNNNLIDISDQECYEVAKNLLFTFEGLDRNSFLYSNADTSCFVEIPKEKRLVKFQIERNLEIEALMIERVKECRVWVNENYDKY